MKRGLAYRISRQAGVAAAVLAAVLAVACTQEKGATFRNFEYKGADPVFNTGINSEQMYYNPILPGFYPDPAICRKGNDYYLVCSSFAYYPGIPIFHSTDLVNWVQIGHVLNRPSQLHLDGIRIDGGVYAPSIHYNPHDDTFYLINTCVDGIGNFIVKTKDPQSGHWSDPIVLPKVGGIDPSMFFDDDGKAYIVHNDAPQGAPQWQGHRAIWMHEYDTNADTTLNNRLMVIDGGTDKRLQPIWIEAPHLYKINGYYYLMCAEGGTGDQHSEVIFRADKVWGPYRPWTRNPILTQRDLPADRPAPVTCAGHADLVQTPKGEWYAVFLGCRPYDKNHFNTGRETFLLPVNWTDAYPVILPKGAPVPYIVEKAGLSSDARSLKGNFTYSDNFNSPVLNDRWIFIRTPHTQWWTSGSGALSMQANGQSIYEKGQPAFIGHRQQHQFFELEAEMSYRPAHKGDIAGLVCFQNENYNIVFGKSLNAQGKACISIDLAQKEVRRLEEAEIPKAYANAPVLLKVKGLGKTYHFFYSFDKGDSWNMAGEIEAGLLSTATAGGFTGVVIGMYVWETGD